MAWVSGDAPDSPWAEIHARTQEALAQLGIEELECFRGLQVEKDSDDALTLVGVSAGDTIDYVIPFASFTTKQRTALNYANSRLGDNLLGVTSRRIIKREDIVIWYHLDAGMATEKEVIAKSDGEETYEIVAVPDREAAKKRVKKAKFAAGRHIGSGGDISHLVKERMVPPDYYQS